MEKLVNAETKRIEDFGKCSKRKRKEKLNIAFVDGVGQS
jgi:hypothetical protein